MRILFDYLKSHRYKLILIIILLMSEAASCFASPVLLGNVVSTGIQKNGFDDSCPVVVSRTAMGIFEGLLPQDVFKEFSGLYCLSDSLPGYCDKKYSTEKKCYYLREDADRETAETLYKNSVTVALIALRNTDGYENYDYDMLAGIFPASVMFSAAKKVSFTEEQKETYYSSVDTVAPALKTQMGDIILPYVYENAGVDCEKAQMQYCINSGIGIIAFTLLQCITAIASALIISSVSADVEFDMRRDITEKAFGFTREAYQLISPAKINDVFSTGIRQVGSALQIGIRAIFYSLISAIIGFTIAFSINRIFGILIFATSLLIMLAIVLLYFIGYKKYYRMQDNYSSYANTVITNLRQMFTIRSAGATGAEQKKVRVLSEKIRKDESFVMNTVLIALSLIGFIVNLLTAAVIIAGSSVILESDINVGSIITCFQISLITVSSLAMLGALCVFAPKAFVVIRNVTEIMKTDVPVASYGEKNVTGQVEEIRFEKVRLFENAPEISFTAKKGQLTLIEGATGTGKTELMLAFLKERRIHSGEIFLNGENINSLSADEPAVLTSFVPSAPVIFTDTVKRNMLLFGAKGDESSMISALKNAGCDFLDYDKDPLNLYLDNNGELFSGGQKSRLCLSFALSKKSPVYIFDGCFSAVDAEMRKKIFANIEKLKNDSIVIILAQNADGFLNADCTVNLTKQERR